VPQNRRKTDKRRVPSRGPRQVIDGHVVVAVKQGRNSGWRITLEINSGQVFASIKRIDTNTDDAAAYRGAGQAGAVVERVASDAGDAVGDRDAGQAGAV